MPRVLVVADESWVRGEVHAALCEPGFELVDHTDPRTAAPTATEIGADVVVVDLQVGSMGGMAVTRALRDAAGISGKPTVPAVMLLDRGADGFLAGRAGASASVVKPFTAHELRTAVAEATATR